MKRIAVLLAALMLVISLTSCSLSDAFMEGFREGWEAGVTETYTVKEMSITLTDLFIEQQDYAEGYDAVFLSWDFSTVVMVSRITDEYPGIPNPDATMFAEVYAANMEAEVTVKQEDGVVFCEQTAPGGERTGLLAFYVFEQTYWVVAMECPAEDYEAKRPDFMKWASSVTFTDEETPTQPDKATEEDTEDEPETQPTGIFHPDVTEDGITFISLGDGTCKIKGADSTAKGRITVPAQSPYGDVVTTVATGAFKGFRSIVSVRLPETVTVIKGSAFQGCKALQHVELPPEVTEFGKAMFEGCGELTSVVLPRGMTEIPAMTFQTCVNLQSVEYRGDVITSIGANAFNGCRSLWELSIPGGLESIGSSAFQNCWPVVYYGGSPEEWERVEINPTNNGGIMGASVIFE